MKKLILFSLVLLSFSCNNPSGEISGTASQSTGQYEVLPGADKPTQVMIEYVYIQPTWGQAFYFALKDGYRWQLVAGIILFAAFILMFVLLAKMVLDVNTKTLVAMSILLIASAAFIFTRPGTIKWNNNIKIEKSIYDKSTGDLPALWESLYTDKRIVGTSGK